MNFPERMVSAATGIEQAAFCQSILARMHDDQGDLGGLTAAEFAAAARIAAWSLFPAVMDSLVGRINSERAISKANDLIKMVEKCAL